MKKNAIGIRCHEIGDKEKKIYALCKEYFGGKYFLCYECSE